MCHQSKIAKAFIGISFASVILLSFLPVFTSPVFAEQVTDAGDAPEVELYQDDSGEWKVKYLNANPAPSADSAPVVNSDNVEVELYKDQSGEWKVKYVNAAQSAEVKTVQKPESGPAKKATTEVAKAAETQPAKVEAKEIKEDKVVKVAKTIPAEPVKEEKVQAVKTSSISGVVPEKTMDEKLVSKPVPTEKSELKPIVKAQPEPQVMPTPKPKITSRPAEPVQKNDESVYEAQSERSHRDNNHHVEIGVDIASYHFKQDKFTNNQDFEDGKKNDGFLGGIHAGYEYVVPDTPPNRSFKELTEDFYNANRYKVTADYKAGSTEYEDVVGFPNENFIQQILEVKGIAGYDIMISEKSRLTPFLGLGYRYVHDPSGGVLDIPYFGIINDAGDLFVSNFTKEIQPGVFDVDIRRHYSTDLHSFYFPVGLMMENDLSRDFSLGLNFEFDYVFLGVIKNSFGELGQLYTEVAPGDKTLGFSDLANHLKGGIGLKGSMRLTKKQNKFDIYLEPYIHYWHLNRSEKQYEMKDSTGEDSVLFTDGTHTKPYSHIEPDSSTSEYGVQAGVSF